MTNVHIVGALLTVVVGLAVLGLDSGAADLESANSLVGGSPTISASLNSPAPRPTEQCRLLFVLENRQREVNADVNEECGCAFDPGCTGTDDCHSCTWGNWGVDSLWSSRQDSNQFRGWQQEPDGTAEWNSCTDVCSSGSTCFNNGDGQQKTTPFNDVREYASGQVNRWIRDQGQGLGCAWLDGKQMLLTSNFLELYELDWADDFVDTITGPTLTINLTCPDEDTCTGQSSWEDADNTPGDISAQIRSRITGSVYIY